MLWSASTDDLVAAEAADPSASKSNKKRKTADKKLAKKQCESVFEQHSDNVTCVAFDADGKSIYSGSFDHTVRRWDVESGNVLKTMVTSIYTCYICINLAELRESRLVD
jgi:WD40 repeat protein